MPLQASHIKSALGIKDYFKVEDLGKYIAGAVYPDSRYFTGVDRQLTHDKGLINPEFFVNNDFRKGWVAHLIADEAYAQEIVNIFPEDFKVWDEKWYKINSAVKIVADLKAAKEIKLEEFFSFFDLIERVNGEDEILMKKYITVMKDLYNKPDLKIEDYEIVFPAEVVGKEIIAEIIKNALDFSVNEKIISRINNLFDNKITEREKAGCAAIVFK